VRNEELVGGFWSAVNGAEGSWRAGEPARRAACSGIIVEVARPHQLRPSTRTATGRAPVEKTAVAIAARETRAEKARLELGRHGLGRDDRTTSCGASAVFRRPWALSADGGRFGRRPIDDVADACTRRPSRGARDCEGRRNDSFSLARRAFSRTAGASNTSARPGCAPSAKGRGRSYSIVRFRTQSRRP